MKWTSYRIYFDEQKLVAICPLFLFEVAAVETGNIVCILKLNPLVHAAISTVNHPGNCMYEGVDEHFRKCIYPALKITRINSGDLFGSKLRLPLHTLHRVSE